MKNRITLVLHSERLEDGSAVWWAESPQVPGFSATAESLQETITLSKQAILDAIAEREVALTALDWEFAFVESDRSEGPEAKLRVVAN